MKYIQRLVTKGIIGNVRTGVAVLTLLALGLAGCEIAPGPGTMPDPDDGDGVQPSVRLSALTPEPAQGVMILIDYEGPAFDATDLRISLGGEALSATVSENQIGVLLPLSHSGAASLAFDFGGGRSATLTLDIAAAPTIPDPRQYLDTEITKLASALSELAARESELQELHDAVLAAQERLAALDEQEIAYAATLFKQNAELALELPASARLLQTAALQTAALQTAALQTAGFDSAECGVAMNAWRRMHVATIAVAGAGGLLFTAPEPLSSAIGLFFLARAATWIPDLLTISIYAADICLQDDVTDIQPWPPRSIHAAQVLASASASLPRVTFVDGEPQVVTITVASRIVHDLRATFLSALSKLRGYLLRFIDNARPVCERCAAWLNRQAERIPQSVEKEERVLASGFVLKGVSNANVTGRISGVDGSRLSLTFTVADSYVPEANDYIDFDFILANSSIGLDDTTIPGRVIFDPEPMFDTTVSGQTYEVDAEITPLVLPEATGGNPPLTYRLTPDVPGLRFDAGTRTLSGTPTTAGRYSMTYTVTDEDGDPDTLAFAIVVTAGSSDILIPETVVVPGGTFRMGALNDWSDNPNNPWWRNCVKQERERDADQCQEFPRHTVTVPSFAMGVCEVTNAQWNACVAEGGCGCCSKEGEDPNHPAGGIYWDDAQEYVAWLSKITGDRYRLPSEAEWEYAARAGTTTRYHTGNTISTDQANFRDSGGKTPVGSFAPNAFGLYDMHGNVSERVQDCWNPNYVGAPSDGSAWESGDCISYRVARGGSWLDSYGGDLQGKNRLRSAAREKSSALGTTSDQGLRVARTLVP